MHVWPLDRLLFTPGHLLKPPSTRYPIVRDTYRDFCVFKVFIRQSASPIHGPRRVKRRKRNRSRNPVKFPPFPLFIFLAFPFCRPFSVAVETLAKQCARHRESLCEYMRRQWPTLWLYSVRIARTILSLYAPMASVHAKDPTSKQKEKLTQA